MSPLKLIGPRTLATLVALLILEAALHHHGGYGWWTVNEQSARYGWKMLPSQAGRSRNINVREDINAAGFRDREWDPPVQAGTDANGQPIWQQDPEVFRVCVVGNSMTFGTSVAIEDTWARQLEQRLVAEFAARGDPRRPLVMNFAVQGYVYEQMARVYQDHIRPYRPDLMIVPSHPHDIMPMTPSADDADYDLRTWIMRTAIHDWIHKRVVNRWIPKVSPSPEAKRIARQYKQLDAQLSERPFARDHARYWDDMIRGKPAIVRDPEASGTAGASAPSGGAQQLEREALLGLLPMSEELAAHGGTLLLLSLPRWRQCFEPKLISTASRWEPLARSREAIVHVDPLADFQPPMRHLVDELQAGRGRRWLDASSARQLGQRFWLTDNLDSQVWVDDSGAEQPGTLLRNADDTLFFLDDVGHYNPRGHAILGEALFRAVQAQGLLEP